MTGRRRAARRLPTSIAALAERLPDMDVAGEFRGLVGHLWRGSALPAGSRVAEAAGLAASDFGLLRASCRASELRAVTAARAVVLALFVADAGPPSEREAPPPPTPRPDDAPRRVSLSPAGVRDAVTVALDAAEGGLEVSEALGRLMPWSGWHLHGTALVEALLIERVEELAELMALSPVLRRIADLLGQLEARARSTRGVGRGGRERVVGVTFSGMLSDVLPCELALLGDPATEDLFYARLAERRLLSLELTGDGDGVDRPPERRGPVICLVDTSGSMHGAREELARAVLLGTLRRVLRDGREVAVLLFGGRGAVFEAELDPRRPEPAILLRLLTAAFHGGTDIDGPLARALERASRGSWRRADILVISDGLCRPRAHTVKRLQAVRSAQGTQLVSIVVGGRGGALAAISDRVATVDVESHKTTVDGAASVR